MDLPKKNVPLNAPSRTLLNNFKRVSDIRGTDYSILSFFLNMASKSWPVYFLSHF